MDKNVSDTDKILSFGTARKSLRSNVLGEVLAYWEALRAGRPAPLRSEVDPRGIERALEYAFIIERVAPSIARFRLAGMHLTDLMGMEVRGMPVTSFFAPQARQKLAEIIETVFTGPETAELTLGAESGIGKPQLKASLLILPLRSDLGDVSRALGCLVAEGEIGRAPRRFDIVEARTRKVAPGRTATAERSLPAATPTPGFAEPGKEFSGVPRPDTSAVRGGHLRLVKSDD